MTKKTSNCSSARNFVVVSVKANSISFLPGMAREALEKLAENPDIHLVLSDINMPVMDGLALLSKLEDTNPDVQAVIVSAYGDMENIRTAMNRGAFDFVTKPINFDDLEITIEKTLNHIRALETAQEARDRLVVLKRELDVAQQVQMSALPKEIPSSETHDVQALMIPAREVGGDFYDFFPLSDELIGLVIADVSGKGIPAALFYPHDADPSSKERPEIPRHPPTA